LAEGCQHNFTAGTRFFCSPPYDGFFLSSFLFPAQLDFWICGSGKGEEAGRAKVLRLIQIRLATLSLAKITPASQDNSRQAQSGYPRSCPQFLPARLRNPESLPAQFSVPKVLRLLIVHDLS
jgi:hypothetical protein